MVAESDSANIFKIRVLVFEILHNQHVQDKSSDIEQQPPFGDRKISIYSLKIRGGGLQNQQEHHTILTKYKAVHPTAVFECHIFFNFNQTVMT